MTWARFIAKIETDFGIKEGQPLNMDVTQVRKLLVRAYTEGYGEGRKQKDSDTHHLIKFLRGPAIVLLLGLCAGCMSKGYRYCVGYMGATVCVDRPHHHFTNDHPRTIKAKPKHKPPRVSTAGFEEEWKPPTKEQSP